MHGGFDSLGGVKSVSKGAVPICPARRLPRPLTSRGTEETPQELTHEQTGRGHGARPSDLEPNPSSLPTSGIIWKKQVVPPSCKEHCFLVPSPRGMGGVPGLDVDTHGHPSFPETFCSFSFRANVGERARQSGTQTTKHFKHTHSPAAFPSRAGSVGRAPRCSVLRQSASDVPRVRPGLGQGPAG